ncbi:MAG: type II secretion system protein GspD, partial [Candidatus Omnitrophica bacterium]|nr:type II secretion system protein GspD [Candidatus Omnitrophota bacterium]
AYDYYPDSNIFIVKELGKPTLELKTKIYQLKYVRLKSSKMEAEVVKMLSEGGESGSNDSGDEVGIKSAVESVLTEFGRVTEDPITNSLIVVDVPVQFSVIDEVISKLDISSTKIMIEVEMMDVSKSRLEKIGFNFANGAYVSLAPGTRQTRFPWDNRLFGPSTGGADPTLSTLSLTSFTTIMQFLSQDSATRFLARPRILTLANETAEVNLTLNEVIGLTTTTNEDGSTTQEIERDDTGTKLRVTPQVNLATNEITLVIDIFNKESVDSNISVSGMTTGFVKNVEERGTKSIVRLKAGDTLFIGGLLKKEEQETITKIPFLGDLPVVGRFFRYKNQPITDNTSRELLIFLTPRIINDGENLIEKVKVLFREQQNYSKESSVKVALDSYHK